MFVADSFGNIDGVGDERFSAKQLYVFARDTFAAAIIINGVIRILYRGVYGCRPRAGYPSDKGR